MSSSFGPFVAGRCDLAAFRMVLSGVGSLVACLEAEAQAEAEQAAEEDKEHSGVPEDNAQRNFTDPQSRIMPGPGGRNFLQAYNCQAVVGHEHQVIVAARAANQASDKQQALVMIQEAIANVGAAPREVSADAGYYSAQAVADLQDLGADPYRPHHIHSPRRHDEPLAIAAIRPRLQSSDGLLARRVRGIMIGLVFQWIPPNGSSVD